MEKIRFSENDVIGTGYRIYHGDVVEILNALPEKSVHLVFSDPPYNLQLKNDLYRPNQTKVAGVDDKWYKFASFAEYDDFTRRWLLGCKRVLRDDGTIWVIGSYHNIFRVGKIMMDLGFWILNDVQWHKTNPMPNFKGVRFTNATETLIWAKKMERQKKYTFNHNVMKQINDGKQMTSVWRIPLCTGKERLKDELGKKAHSTQKPEELLRRVILSSSSEGDIVLDPFLGSGTTSAVARKLNRLSIGIEKELAYVEIAKKRIISINPLEFNSLRLIEKEKTTLFRVSMQKLLADKYIQEGLVLHSKNGKVSAVVQNDGSLKNGVGAGSIHKMGAILKGTKSCNGWTYWYYKDSDNNMLPIGEIRKKYGEDNGLQAV